MSSDDVLMRSGRRVAGAAALACVVLAACAGGDYTADGDVADSAAAAPHTALVTTESGGDVAADSASPRGKWLDDGNVLALLGVLNARQIDAANVELGAWHSDTVRAFASAMLAEHEALQHSADSLAAVLRVAPVTPALADSVSATLQARVDSLRGVYGAPLDRAFIAEQIASDQVVDSYLRGLSGIAERPEVQALLTTAEAQTASQLDRAQTLQSTIAAVDSVTADSLARRRAKQRQPQH